MRERKSRTEFDKDCGKKKLSNVNKEASGLNHDSISTD